MAHVGNRTAVLGLFLVFLCTSQRHGCCHVAAAKLRPLLADPPGTGQKGEAIELSDVNTTDADATIDMAGELEKESEQSVRQASEPSGTGCVSSGSSDCHASVLQSLRVDVLVKSLRLHRWTFGARSDASVESDARDADVDVSVHVADAAASDPWSAMSSDEVDLFFPNVEDYEDGAQDGTVILQLQA